MTKLRADIKDGPLMSSFAQSSARFLIAYAAGRFPFFFKDVSNPDLQVMIEGLSAGIAFLIYAVWSWIDRRMLRDTMPRPESLVQKDNA